MNWFLHVVKHKYASFGGRAGRPEYWFFLLIYILISIFLGVADAVLGTGSPSHGVGLIGALFALAMLLPSIAVTVRRLHDSDRTGWWILVGFVPAIGWLVLLVFMVLAGTPGDNRFGPAAPSDVD